MASKIDHLAFRVTDLDKISAHLQKLGYVEVRRTAHGVGAVEMESPEQPGLILEFTLPRSENEALGFDHACFTLNGEDELKELVAAGFPSSGKTKFNDSIGRWLSDWKDDDGKKWQFILN